MSSDASAQTLIAQHPVVVYFTPYCWYCQAALRLLKTKGVAAHQVNTQSNASLRSWLREVTGQSTVPQIFIGGKPVGGFTELDQLDDRGELDLLLEEVSACV